MFFKGEMKRYKYLKEIDQELKDNKNILRIKVKQEIAKYSGL